MTVFETCDRVSRPTSSSSDHRTEVVTLALAWAITLALFSGSERVQYDLNHKTRRPFDIELHLDDSLEKTLDAVDEQFNNISTPQIAAERLSSFSIPSILEIGEISKEPPQDKTDSTLNVTCTFESEFVTVRANNSGSSSTEWQSQQMLQQFIHLISELNGLDKTAPLSKALTLNANDQKKLLRWNGSEVPVVKACVHDLIHQKCLEQPTASAVNAWDGDFTYQELDQLSSKLARHLIKFPMDHETFIPLCFEKSRWTTVAMLAVLKTGAAFVLLDPSHPLQRRQWICSTVKSTIVICSATQAESASSLVDNVVQVSDKEAETWPNAAPISKPIPPSNPAYVAFTSGSTGTPKGAVIEHSAFSTGAQGQAKNFGIHRDSRVFQFASYAFDISIMENLTTLLQGGCVCVPSDEDRNSNLIGAINQLKANFLCTTPSVAALLSPDVVPGLRNLVLMGETPTQAMIEAWSGITELVLSYGPTECTVLCTARRSLEPSSDPKDVGHAFNSLLWVTHPQNRDILIPVGGIGELCIEGPILGREYLHLSEKTADTFYRNPPWLPARESRRVVYRTGDLARLQSDGSLYFLGRRDAQVKIRGQRVELGEIEYQVREAFGAHHAVAGLIHPKSRGGSSLLATFVLLESADNDAFSVSQSPLAPSSEAFFSRSKAGLLKLSNMLPDYMIPSLFLPLRYLPLTLTGKIDRLRLWDVGADLSKTDLDSYMVSHPVKTNGTSSEERRDGWMIRTILATVLNIPMAQIQLQDNFFHIGGDSINSMRLALAVRAEGVPLTVSEIFSHPVLSDLQNLVDEKRTEPGPKVQYNRPTQLTLFDIPNRDAVINEDIATQLLLSSKQTIEDVVPMTKMQEYMGSFPRQYYKLYLKGKIDRTQLKAACKMFVERHPIFRTVFVEHEGQMLQIVLNRIDTNFQFYEAELNDEVADLLQQICQHDDRMPIPSSYPVIQFTLVNARDSSDDHVLVLRLSHVQYDGESWLIMIRDLAALYAGWRPSSPAAGFTDWVYNHFSGRTPSVTSYWKDFLHGSSMTYIGNQFGPEDPAEEMLDVTKTIASTTPPHGITMATVVKAAWSLVLAQFSKSDDIIFAQYSHGRAQTFPGIETIVGPCLNLVPVRVRHQFDTWTGMDLLNDIQKQHGDSMAHESFEPDDLVANCTDWTSQDLSKQFGSYVLHQHVDYYSESNGLKFGEAVLEKYELFYRHRVVRELLLYSIPRAAEHEFTVAYTSAMMDLNMATSLLNTATGFVKALCSNPEVRLDGLEMSD